MVSTVSGCVTRLDFYGMVLGNAFQEDLNHCYQLCHINLHCSVQLSISRVVEAVFLEFEIVTSRELQRRPWKRGLKWLKHFSICLYIY